MNALTFDSRGGNVWEESQRCVKTEKCVCVCVDLHIRSVKKPSGNSPPLLITRLVFALSSQAEPSPPRLPGRLAAGQRRADPRPPQKGAAVNKQHG